jgi:hypothetical protein
MAAGFLFWPYNPDLVRRMAKVADRPLAASDGAIRWHRDDLRPRADAPLHSDVRRRYSASSNAATLLNRCRVQNDRLTAVVRERRAGAARRSTLTGITSYLNGR